MFLRDQSGFAVCRAIRENPDAKDVPILVVTRSTSDLDRILALEAGADDVVVRPFFPRELALRVRALLRRTEGERARAEPPLAHGPIALDTGRRSVHADGEAGRADRDRVRAARAPAPRAPRMCSPATRSWPSSGPKDPPGPRAWSTPT